jgi:hypothetical protein
MVSEIQFVEYEAGEIPRGIPDNERFNFGKPCIWLDWIVDSYPDIFPLDSLYDALYIAQNAFLAIISYAIGIYVQSKSYEYRTD